VKVRGKVRRRTGHEGPETEQRYSSTLSLSSALDGGESLTPRFDRFTPGKDTRYPLYGRLGGPQGPCGRVQKTKPPPGLDPRTVQPVDSRYTDYNIPVYSSQHIPLKTCVLSGYGCAQIWHEWKPEKRQTVQSDGNFLYTTCVFYPEG
jgi:hypothetical protein